MSAPTGHERPDDGARAGAEALARARDELRRPRPEDAEGWAVFARSLRRRLRDVARPGRPLRVVEEPGGQVAGVLRVDERVVVDAARRAVRTQGARLVGLVLDVTDERPAGASLEVWAPYGSDVREVAEVARETVTGVVEDLLGVRCPVDVTVVDVWSEDASDGSDGSDGPDGPDGSEVPGAGRDPLPG